MGRKPNTELGGQRYFLGEVEHIIYDLRTEHKLTWPAIAARFGASRNAVQQAFQRHKKKVESQAVQGDDL